MAVVYEEDHLTDWLTNVEKQTLDTDMWKETIEKVKLA